MNWLDSAKKLLQKRKAQAAESDFFGGKLTPRARETLQLARLEAIRLNHHFIGTEHLLLGLVRLDKGVAVNVLQKLGIGLDRLRSQVEKCVGRGPEPPVDRLIPYAPQIKSVFELSVDEAKRLHHAYVGTEHLLLGLLAEANGVAARVLKKDFYLDLDVLRQEIIDELTPNILSHHRTTQKDRIRNQISRAVRMKSCGHESRHHAA